MADSPDTPELAVAELLRRIPETWQTYRPDDLTQTQSQAFSLLIGAGMVEHRGHGRLRMLNHPVMVECTYTATGESGLAEAFEKVCAAMWTDWQEAYNKWKQGDGGDVSPFHVEQLEPFEWRLTDQGILARKDAAGGEQDVFDFVLKRGFFGGQPRQMPDGRIMLQRNPVHGTGSLIRMERLNVDAAVTGTVNVGNWAEGADAFAKAFGGMPAKTAPSGGAVAQGGNLPVEPPEVKIQPSPKVKPAADSDIDRQMASKRKTMKWLAEAMTLVQQKPDLSNAAIARAVGVHPSRLSRNTVYKSAAKMARQRPAPPRGTKGKDGTIEAEDE
jgi:hypothetical protein